MSILTELEKLLDAKEEDAQQIIKQVTEVVRAGHGNVPAASTRSAS